MPNAVITRRTARPLRRSTTAVLSSQAGSGNIIRKA
jgi:hypothetical protein